MNIVLGIFVVVSSVLGGYLLSHGYLLALWQPYELIIILGAATGGLIIANPAHILSEVAKGLPTLLKKSPYDKQLYLQLLGMIYELFMRARKNGMLSLESHVENPSDSFIFQQYPRLTRHHPDAVIFLVDYLRLIVGGNMNSYELDNLMDIELATHEHEVAQPSGALSSMADGLPGFGIVAAVMGIVITMSSLGGPVEETGQHLAAALVGTFLGILLSYGFVGPLAKALQYQAEEEAMMLSCIKTTLVASLNGYAPVVAVEFGRKAIPARLRPDFYELEAHIRELGLHEGAKAG